MKWVKGELLTDLDASGVDPTRQLNREAQAILFNRHTWFARVWRYFPTPALAPLIARATSEGAIAWLFLVREAGGRAVSLSNWYSFAYNAVYKGTPDDTSKRIMLTAIAKRLGTLKPSLSRITISPVPRADVALFIKAFKQGRWKCVATPVSTSWTATVAGMSFAEFWAARPGQLRSTYSRKKNKAVFEVSIYDHFDESAWAEYEAVYTDSWKPDEGAPGFVRETAEHESAAGCLRLGICRIEGIAAAAQYWTVENGIAYIHKLAHLESAKSLSPGTILSHDLFEYVIDNDHVSKIDFGTGDDAYKADWMEASEPLDKIIFYNLRTISGNLSAIVAGIKAWIRQLREGKKSDS